MTDEYRLIGIDFGLAKVGLAVASFSPAQPLEVIRYRNEKQLLRQLHHLILQEQATGLVVGWPADHLTFSTPQTEYIRRFGERLGQLTGLPVVYYPETLTTQEATRRMIESGISRKRRSEVEDSYAAAAILDGYLDGLQS